MSQLGPDYFLLNDYCWIEFSFGGVLEVIVSKSREECISRRVKWISGARVLIAWSVARCLARSLDRLIARSLDRSVAPSIAPRTVQYRTVLIVLDNGARVRKTMDSSHAYTCHQSVNPP